MSTRPARLSPNVLELDGATKRYGSLTALDDVSLSVRENEFFALLGPSGCGKTTLLRMIAGFETPSGGRILLDGKDISPLPANRRPLNLMFQSYALFPHMSVRKNIAYGLEMERLPKERIRSQVDEVLATTDLQAVADRRPDQLSGGQRQRVALARALVKRPRVLLLDEPLGALDKKLREKMQLELKRLQHEIGITFVVVTHDQEEALVMADRVAVLKDGRLQQCGAPRELYEYPKNRFVADFIGVTNFIEGRIADGGLRASSGQILKCAIPAQARPDDEAVLAVRPERLKVLPTSSAAPDTDNLIAGRIVDIAYHGLDLQLHILSDASRQPVLARVSAAENDTQGFVKGMTVHVGWDADNSRILRD